MDTYFLDLVSWQRSQGLYHAAAHLGREALFILRPATPYVCLGFHQDVRQEIDLEFAAQHHIPVFRREVGGGAVYLDSGQLFYQLILRRDHPAVPASKTDLYQKFLEPVADTYRGFGIDAHYRPINDIVTAAGRKISGNGAAEIENMIVLVGNFILDFNFEMMSKVLRVPDEKFRDKVYKTMSESLTTMRRESGHVPETSDLAVALAQHLEPLLGPLTARELDPELVTQADQLVSDMLQPDWLYAADRRPTEREVKIAEGVFVVSKMIKTPGGLLRVTTVKRQGCLTDVQLTGDFFFYPAERLSDLERTLEGVPVEAEAILSAVQAFYDEYQVESPGLRPESFAEVLATT